MEKRAKLLIDGKEYQSISDFFRAAKSPEDLKIDYEGTPEYEATRLNIESAKRNHQKYLSLRHRRYTG